MTEKNGFIAWVELMANVCPVPVEGSDPHLTGVESGLGLRLCKALSSGKALSLFAPTSRATTTITLPRASFRS